MREWKESKAERNICKAIEGIKEDISKINKEYPPSFKDVKVSLVKKETLPDYYTNTYLYQILGTVVNNHISIVPDGGNGNHKSVSIDDSGTKQEEIQNKNSNKYK